MSLGIEVNFVAVIDPIWKERKRTIFGLPLSFTTYRVTEDRLFISSGLLSTKEEEIRLYRILDLTLNRSLEQRLFGLGSIHLCTADKSTPEITLHRLKDSAKVRDMLSELVEKVRHEKGIKGRELFGDDMDEHF